VEDPGHWDGRVAARLAFTRSIAGQSSVSRAPLRDRLRRRVRIDVYLAHALREQQPCERERGDISTLELRTAL
jgi:hypothetical protein